MSTRARGIAAAALVAAAAGGWLLLRGGGTAVPGRTADIPREDPSKFPRSLRISPEALDFGEIAVGQKKTLSFSVENKGTRPVTVYRVILSCVCLSGGTDPIEIGPGHVVPIPITFTGLPGKRSWVSTAGVITDEPGASRYDVPVTGKIRQAFLLEPETVNLGRCEKGDARSAEVDLRRRDGGDFEIRGIKASRPEFSFTWAPVQEGKKSAYKIVATGKTLVSGSVADTAVVTTDRDADGAPQLTLTIEVNAEIVSEPSVASATIAANGLLSPFEVRLRHKAGSPVKVLSVQEARENAVDFSAEAAPEGGLRLSIRFKNGLPSGPPLGEFLIGVEGENEPLHLPYRIEGAGPAGSQNP